MYKGIILCIFLLFTTVSTFSLATKENDIVIPNNELKGINHSKYSSSIENVNSFNKIIVDLYKREIDNNDYDYTYSLVSVDNIYEIYVFGYFKDNDNESFIIDYNYNDMSWFIKRIKSNKDVSSFKLSNGNLKLKVIEVEQLQENKQGKLVSEVLVALLYDIKTGLFLTREGQHIRFSPRDENLNQLWPFSRLTSVE